MTNLLTREFNRLAKSIDDDTHLYSMMEPSLNHPAFREIVAMGEVVVPLLFARTGGWWRYEAVRQITGGEPFTEYPGSSAEVRRLWHEWAVAHGYTS